VVEQEGGGVDVGEEEAAVVKTAARRTDGPAGPVSSSPSHSRAQTLGRWSRTED
jgi:hypothetical protein